MVEESAPLIVRHDEDCRRPIRAVDDRGEGVGEERVTDTDVGVRMIAARRAGLVVDERGSTNETLGSVPAAASARNSL